jgi:hypothetical protein
LGAFAKKFEENQVKNQDNSGIAKSLIFKKNGNSDNLGCFDF